MEKNLIWVEIALLLGPIEDIISSSELNCGVLVLSEFGCLFMVLQKIKMPLENKMLSENIVHPENQRPKN